MTATSEVLDLERMRSDVARVLECTPAEIGDDDPDQQLSFQVLV